MDIPRVTFGMIVLNGEPFTRYNLRALYPFAHEIIVVEGAVEKARFAATPDGHSTDGTLEALRRFKETEDPDDKLQIVTRDGFWSEKDEQSQAYAARATGDLLWQVDVDEFYQPGDMRAVLERLAQRPAITMVSFKTLTFWGGFDYITDGWYLRRGSGVFRRLFRWGAGYRYDTHRPPTVLDPQGRDLYMVRRLDGDSLARREGIYLYHYSLVFPKQVAEKSAYYRHMNWVHSRGAAAWAEAGYARLARPYHVHNVYRYPSWLERYEGEHPPAIRQLRADIAAGAVAVALRPVDDIERLLRSRRYALGRAVLKPLAPLYRLAYQLRHPRGERDPRPPAVRDG
ncbi:MAG: glycosyltransferase family A protein [Anaerolineae bacterium]